jgi:hypothetical protein
MEFTANKQMEAVELRRHCDNLQEWEFVTARLTKLGLLYFKDLSVSYNECMASSELAKTAYEAKGDMSGYEAEMELLNKAGDCVTGLPIRVDAIYDMPILYEETLPDPDFYLSPTFVKNSDGQAVLFMI